MDSTRICIGEVRSYREGNREVSLSLDDLFHHQYVLGATGTGKSTLIAREVIQAFNQGLCCLVIDPHGDLSYDIAEAVSKQDLKDVYFFDPLKVGFSLNPFELPKYSSEEERELAVEKIIGEMIEFLSKLYGRQYWGPSLNRIFQEGLRSLYQKDDSPTFKDLLDLVNKKLKGHYEFYEEIESLPSIRIDAVINKLVPFAKSKLLKKIFSQKTSTLDLEQIIAPRKLIIFRLSKGELSETNSALIGSTVITKLWFHAASKGKEERIPIFLAIDEFQNFSHMETLRNMVAEGRKYKIAMLLAHQHTQQIPEKLLGDILGNVGTKIIFRISGEDASLISKSLGYNSKLIPILTNLPYGRAVVKKRGEFGKDSIPPFEIATLPLYKKNFLTEAVIARMKERFAAKIEEEEQLEFEPEIYDLIKTIDKLTKEGKESKVGLILEEYRKINPSIRGTGLSNLIDKAENLGLASRRIVKQKIGRPKIIVDLTGTAKEKLGYGLGSSTKAGGDLHRALILGYAKTLEERGYMVISQEQKGSEEQPDLIAKARDSDKEIAIEVETDASHPEQVIRNYEKNIKAGREVIFVVPDEKIEKRVLNILGEKARIEIAHI